MLGKRDFPVWMHRACLSGRQQRQRSVQGVCRRVSAKQLLTRKKLLKSVSNVISASQAGRQKAGSS